MICELVLIYGAWINPCEVIYQLKPREYGKHSEIQFANSNDRLIYEPCGQVARAINEAIKEVAGD